MRFVIVLFGFYKALSEGPLGERRERQHRRSGIQSCERNAGTAPGRAASSSGTAAIPGRLCPSEGLPCRPVRPRQCGVTEWGVTSPASSEGRDMTSAWQRAFVVCPSECSCLSFCCGDLAPFRRHKEEFVSFKPILLCLDLCMWKYCCWLSLAVKAVLFLYFRCRCQARFIPGYPLGL